MATLAESWSKIRLQINSATPAIKRPAVVLSAIEATLAADSSQADQIEPAAYFVALVSTLDQLVQDPQAAQPASEPRQLLEATLYLLSVLVPHLDPATLRSKLAATLATLAPLFASFAESAPPVKSLVQIAQAFLAAAPQTTLEKDLHGARSSYAAVLSLCADSRPKVRRRAQEAVQHILKNPPPPGTTHPYADESAHWICGKLDDAIRGAKRGGKKDASSAKEVETGSDESRAIALLTFVKNMGTAWPQSSTRELLPLLLSTLTLSSPHLTLSALTVLSHLFSASHAADTMSDDHVKETLEALVKARPKAVESEQGEKLLAGWVEGVGEGLVALARTDSTLALEQLAILFPTILPILTTANTPALRQSVETACALMIKHCVTDAEIVAAVEHKNDAGTTIVSVIEQVEKAMTSPRYAALSQPHVLALVKALFLRLRLRVPSFSASSSASAADPRDPPAASTLLTKALVLLAKSREDSRFEWKKEADAVLDTVIKVLGPEVILSYLPLNLSPEDAAQSKHARAWLLPLLKPAITNTRLNHFRESFVPLSAQFFNKAEEARNAEPPRAMEAKVWETLVGQTWALLPGYCEYPVDLAQSFDTEFVSLVANVLYTQPTLRPSIFKSLQTLLSTTLALAKSTSPAQLLQDQFGLTPEQGRASLDHLRSLAQTILSVAFNVYGKMNRGEGGYVLETIGAWTSILPASELSSTYTKISTLLLQALEAPLHPKEDPTIPPTHALLDILISIIPHSAPVEREFFDLAMSEQLLGNEKDQSVQKKAYRIAARLCEERGGNVIKGREGEVVERIVEAGGKVANGAKRDRVSLLSALVPVIPADSLHFIPSLIPEAVLSTKESNGVTREAAYTLIVSMANKLATPGATIKRHLIKGMEDTMEEEVPASEDEFITMVSAGLAATSPHMIAATVGALGRLIWEFHNKLGNAYLAELVDTLVVFLTSPNREIVKSAIGFIKVSIVSLDASVVTPSLPALVPALVNWSHEHSNHFKVNIRHLFERMIRKYGYNEIERYVPEDDKKLVSSIRKRQARSKKKKLAQMEVENEDDDEEAAPKPQAAARSAYDEVLYGSDSDVSVDEDAPQDPALTAPSGVKNRKSVARKNKKEQEGAYIQEDEDEVLDLLDDRMMSRISAARPAPSKKQPRKALESHFKTDASGRLEFNESDDESDRRAAVSSRSAAARMDADDVDSGMGAYLEAMRGEDGHTRDAKGRIKFNKGGKRGRFDEADDGEDVPVTEGLKELEVAGNNKKRKTKKETVQVGGEFKAKRAGGDVKKNGMQPYAFVPLSTVGGKKSNQKGPKLGITGLKKSSKK
ncbi:mRNA-binding protein RRP12 [Sporobolomyces koalae]|uniref:mRNA-binding protein RRP12 n=1 Tax=Sporobolomyces koalae TaxID=500713 RepID=UPI003177A4B4